MLCNGQTLSIFLLSKIGILNLQRCKELENVSVRKNKHKKHLHEILTPKEETERCIFVNRDKNACKNILYIGKYFLKNQSRPIEFCQKSKEKIIVVKQRKPRQKKEIVV